MPVKQTKYDKTAAKIGYQEFNQGPNCCNLRTGTGLVQILEKVTTMKKSLLLAGAAFIALGTAASAATFTVDGIRGVIPAAGQTNEVLDNVFGMGSIAGFFGSTVSITDDATINVNYFGYEAGFDNGFSITNGTDTVSFATGAADFAYAADALNPIASETIDVVAGVLDFSFTSFQGGDVSNGSNTDNTAVPAIANFFTSLSITAETVFLFFDDTGAGDDDNHDDFVVSLSIVPPGQEPEPVPLPAGGLLLIGGLGALAVARRRKVKA